MDSTRYDVIIGLEIHIQSKTESKMFCGCCTNYFQKDPNTLTCPTCLGLPGALPVPNKKAIELCILLGLATNCDIDNQIRFDRKHYYYPDLPKGYQISQYDKPICKNGYVSIFDKSGQETKIFIERIHQEEDVAKSTHHKDSEGREFSLVDYNKSGVPLIEIVSRPVIKSALEAKMYASKIRQLVRWLGISDADMEKGQMRCEPNISIQEKGKWKEVDGKILPIEGYKLNPKVEVKNIGSISAIEKAIEYEIKRMIQEIEEGKKLIQQTRGWNPVSASTVFQRSKESAQDYRYFPEPDIPIIDVSDKDIENIRGMISVLPDTIYSKYISEYGLSHYDSSILTSDKKIYEYFESGLKIVGKELAKELSNWITGTLFALANELGKDLTELGVSFEELSNLIVSVKNGEINISKAKELVAKSVKEGVSLSSLLLSSDVKVISDESELEKIARNIVENNPKPVADYKGGKKTVIMFLVGLVMKETKGNAQPNKVKDILEKILE